MTVSLIKPEYHRARPSYNPRVNMTAQIAPAASIQVLTPAENSTRFSEVLATIGRTQKMMVLCGEDVCLAEGLLVGY